MFWKKVWKSVGKNGGKSLINTFGAFGDTSNIAYVFVPLILDHTAGGLTDNIKEDI